MSGALFIFVNDLIKRVVVVVLVVVVALYKVVVMYVNVVNKKNKRVIDECLCSLANFNGSEQKVLDDTRKNKWR